MQRPSALGLFLCDQVSIDRDTGRRMLIGLFEVLTVDEFPFTSPPFTIYAELTDGQGRIPLTLLVRDIDNEFDVVEALLVIDLPGPLAIAHIRVRIPGLSFPETGQYLFELLCQDESVCHRRLDIQRRED